MSDRWLRRANGLLFTVACIAIYYWLFWPVIVRTP